ncbi:hypothetical protein PFLUV_G00259830 [Perca fluviatilis]|uniref:Uncharacterized protein n=1 Tax=Perca fluviatilis TaxID=8168 RepID=A0A6A5DNY1_PERFL|nr:hypothetical protein PFLUV_G00259830 [Perca fluviatilis]
MRPGRVEQVRLHLVRPEESRRRKLKAEAGLTSDQKMSDLEEEEDGAESVVSGCQSRKSDRSRRDPPDFSTEPGPSDTNCHWNLTPATASLLPSTEQTAITGPHH